jgi:polyhydroxyalkanoate synthesis regulator phasin
MLKDIISFGLGSALLIKEKVEEELKELVEKGKISQEEVKELLENAKKRGEEEEIKAKEELKKAIKEVISELNLATKEDILSLEKKLEK